MANANDGRGLTTPCRRMDPPSRKYGKFDAPDQWVSPEFVNLRFQILGEQPLQDMCKFCFGNWRE